MTHGDALRHRTLIEETDRRRPSAGRYLVWQDETRVSLCYEKGIVARHFWFHLPLATAAIMCVFFSLSAAPLTLALWLGGAVLAGMSIVSWVLWKRHVAAPALEEWITLNRTGVPTLEIHLTSLSIPITDLECLALRQAMSDHRSTGNSDDRRYHWFLYAKLHLEEFRPIHVASASTISEQSFLPAVREFCNVTHIPLMEPPADREIVIPVV